ncbi:carbohydrate ABC transporter permease [Pseudoroseicyclus aestuarii]|uniref:Carbohydrate ABC transporter membrane protein 2 (CUT1 family) n=1 Tax=Pseudoroseicyclus aestuarii TaxID=1795041 RepID=A0A318SP72_9RHOB|nr:carbohydrate ABC transporter permease [Pseudoroseicyclus aestuarii]PYE82446.1 carbohydrate ABC transporter membrane protein 2 (CUT1 family) [Pseudoroseicyclus aestuarii]
MSTDTRPSSATSAALAFMAVIWVSPFAWLLSNAFDTGANGQLRLPAEPGLGNFLGAMSGPALTQFWNSMFIGVGTATLTLVVGSGAAYALSRLRIPGRNGLLWSLVLLRMLPPTGILVPIYFAAQSVGLLNNLGIVVALTVLNLPFAMLLLKNFFDTVPVELEEAAHVEGASLPRILWRVVMPMSRAGLAVVWFFTFTSAWNEFLFPLLFSRTEDAFPMSIGLYSAFGRNGSIEYGFLAAFSIIYAAPAIAVYFLLRRNMNTGFAGVGVKG